MATQQSKRHSGRKLARSSKHATMYAAQYKRTRRNKIRRLMRRLDFDPTAEPAIKRLEAKSYPTR